MISEQGLLELVDRLMRRKEDASSQVFKDCQL